MGPLGAAQYLAIWPWNVACIAVLLYFRRAPASHDLPVSLARRAGAMRRENGGRLTAARFVACWLLPALFFVLPWYPAYLSWSMFGGDVKQGVVLARTAADLVGVRGVDMFQSREAFVPYLLAPIADAAQWEWKAHVYLYPYFVLGVPFVPERSVFVAFFALLCRDAEQAAGLALEIQQPAHRFFGSWATERLFCSDVVMAACR